MNEVQSTLYELSSSASHIQHEYFNLTSTYFNKRTNISEYQSMVLKQLPINCHLTSEILVANQRLWDNEMLLRSVMEGTIKFTFLTLGTKKTERKR